MINENRIGLKIQPWPVVVPVMLIGILTIGTNLIADGLGRALIGIERDTGVG
jgi:peptide/nickel transport system permease protein